MKRTLIFGAILFIAIVLVGLIPSVTTYEQETPRNNWPYIDTNPVPSMEPLKEPLPLPQILATSTESTTSPQTPQNQPETILVATLTKYGPTGNKMASGRFPYIGAVAVSDRTIPLGTKIYIDGKEYTVEDRTALWVHEKHGLTIDIFSNKTYPQMRLFGRQPVVCNNGLVWHCVTKKKESKNLVANVVT